MQKLDAREAMPVTLGRPTPGAPSPIGSRPPPRSGRLTPMSLLETWTRAEHEAADGTTRPTYRKGTGPGVIVIHEVPGITPTVIAFAEEVVASGFTVVMPHLFGRPETPSNAGTVASAMIQVCTAAEFTKLATGVTAPISTWLRDLAHSLHAELGGPGVGALG